MEFHESLLREDLELTKALLRSISLQSAEAYKIINDTLKEELSEDDYNLIFK